MDDFEVKLTLKFAGKSADNHLLDLYDLSQSLIGLQRSLALTTHLVLNDEVITQSPSLRGAVISAAPPRPGSWEIAVMVTSGIFALTTAPKESPVGHLIRSAYYYVIKENLGFHVDYDKTLGQQYQELKDQNQIKKLSQHRFDSVIEKCENAISEIHRPIFASQSAESAAITAQTSSGNFLVGEPFTAETYDYIHFTSDSDYPEIFHGSISSFNLNTYRGRIFISEYGRPVPFSVQEALKNRETRVLITSSAAENARNGLTEKGQLLIRAFVRKSRSGQTKNLHIVEISEYKNSD